MNSGRYMQTYSNPISYHPQMHSTSHTSEHLPHKKPQSTQSFSYLVNSTATKQKFTPLRRHRS